MRGERSEFQAWDDTILGILYQVGISYHTLDNSYFNRPLCLQFILETVY